MTDKQIKAILDRCKTYGDFEARMNEIFYDPIIKVAAGNGDASEIVARYDVRNVGGYILADVWLQGARA